METFQHVRPFSYGMLSFLLLFYLLLLLLFELTNIYCTNARTHTHTYVPITLLIAIFNCFLYTIWIFLCLIDPGCGPKCDLHWPEGRQRQIQSLPFEWLMMITTEIDRTATLVPSKTVMRLYFNIVDNYINDDDDDDVRSRFGHMLPIHWIINELSLIPTFMLMVMMVVEPG